MKKRHLVTAVAVVLTAAACDSSTKPAASSEAITTPPKASTSAAATTSSAPSTTAAASSACTDLGGTVGDDQLCTVHTETPNYTIDMSFPVTYPDQRAVIDVLTRQRDQFVTMVEEPPVRDVAKALEIKPATYRSGLRPRYRKPGPRGVRQLRRRTSGDVLRRPQFRPRQEGADHVRLAVQARQRPVPVLDPIVQAALKNQLPGAPVDDNPDRRGDVQELRHHR